MNEDLMKYQYPSLVLGKKGLSKYKLHFTQVLLTEHQEYNLVSKKDTEQHKRKYIKFLMIVHRV
jgi:hypothetical protein